MKHLRNSIIALTVILCSLSARGQYTEYDIYAYIDTYKELAINKMYEYKIPASITIAQGIFESACGKSHLAVDGNNQLKKICLFYEKRAKIQNISRILAYTLNFSILISRFLGNFVFL